MPTKILRPRGRPRGFDTEAAVATAGRLFHARGYDGVSVAELAAAIGINPPSFYAAFGSKAGLYARVVERYQRTNGVPLADILAPGRDVGEALAAVLEAAALAYACDPEAAGCLVLEGTRCNDVDARATSCVARRGAEEMIRAFVAAQRPEAAGVLTDFVVAMMTGLSAAARAGVGRERLVAVARQAKKALLF